jgi:hypothetical protein
MPRRIFLRLIAAILAGLMPASLAHLQAQECNGVNSRSLETAHQIKIMITSVEFPVGDVLPDQIRTQLKRNVEKQEFIIDPGEPDTEWLSQLNEVVVRDVFANAGYFLAQTSTTPYLIRAEAEKRFYTVRIDAEGGLLYRLGELRFENASVFPQDDIRRQVGMMTGEPFDVAKVRKAIESITALYSTKGYIDATIEPRMDVDDKKQLINLTLRVSEETQYSVGMVEILGLEDGAKNRLVDRLQPGRVFDASVLHSFLEADGRNVALDRHVHDGIVDVVLDARESSCIEGVGKS